MFGFRVARELDRLGVAVTIAGRDRAKAEAAARSLGPRHDAISADATDRESCARVLSGRSVVVSCAGPFSTLGDTLLDASLRARCHYVDIGDDRAHSRLVRSRSAAFAEAGRAAVYGCSSLPGLSGALALIAREGQADAPLAARVVLFIGNDNPKGSAAIRSLLRRVGQSIPAPQGALVAFGERRRVELPEPFRRGATNLMDSPDYDLLPSLLGVKSVRVEVGFELPLASFLIAAMGAFPVGLRDRAGRALSVVGGLTRPLGHSGGVVAVTLTWGDGRSRTATLHSAADGQRMVALPCALATVALAQGRTKVGSLAAYELLGARPLLDAIAAQGFSLSV